MSARTVPCPKPVRLGRLRKAEQFLQAANVLLDADGSGPADAYVSLCVNAGIGAGDVICCAVLGKHSVGEDHRETVALLKQAHKEAAKHLDVLLGMKTKAAYTSTPVSAADVKRAGRSATAIVEIARQKHAAAG